MTRKTRGTAKELLCNDDNKFDEWDEIYGDRGAVEGDGRFL
jgi:hypothetical protein